MKHKNVFVEKSYWLRFFDTEEQAKDWISVFGTRNWYLTGGHIGMGYTAFSLMDVVTGMKYYSMADAYDRGMIDDLDFFEKPFGWVVHTQHKALD